MKEFNHWFTICFSYRGKDIEKTISLKQIEIWNYCWYYTFSDIIKDEKVIFEVFGTYDDDKNIRTSGECYINGVETLSAFGIDVLNEDDDRIAVIADIDIIDSD